MKSKSRKSVKVIRQKKIMGEDYVYDIPTEWNAVQNPDIATLPYDLVYGITVAVEDDLDNILSLLIRDIGGDNNNNSIDNDINETVSSTGQSKIYDNPEQSRASQCDIIAIRELKKIKTTYSVDMKRALCLYMICISPSIIASIETGIIADKHYRSVHQDDIYMFLDSVEYKEISRNYILSPERDLTAENSIKKAKLYVNELSMLLKDGIWGFCREHS